MLTQPPSGHFAQVGLLSHRAIELYSLRQAANESVDPMAVLREVLHEALADREVTQGVVGDTIEIMAGAFASPDLKLGLPPAPWQTVVEWRWGLDDDFAPVAPCGKCGGEGHDASGKAPCHVCHGSGWSRTVAYEGTIDRMPVLPGKGIVQVQDFKSSLLPESSEEQETDKQAQTYAVAALAHYPAATEVEWVKVFLRGRYSARHTFARGGAWHEVRKARMRAARAKRLEAIETNVWPYSPGEACSYCPLLWTCPELVRRRAEGSEPPGDLTYQANTLLALRAQLKVIDTRLRAHVAASEEPIPLDDGEGTALGMKPVRGYLMARSYERTLNELESLGMTARQREAWFRFVTEDNMPSRVKKALEELVGRKTARALIESGGWLEEVTNFEFGVWCEPSSAQEAGTVPVPATEETVDDAIAKAQREDPERLRRIAAALT